MTRTLTKFLLILLITGLNLQPANSQVVWENPNTPVYPFLQRQAQKGLIELDDLIQPFSRKHIYVKLSEIRDSTTYLSSTEKKELNFFLQEYAEFDNSLPDSSGFFKKDEAGRWRLLSVKKDGFILRGDPVLQSSFAAGQGKNVFTWANGLNFWGHAGTHFSFQATFRDITESGDGIDSTRQFTANPGIVKTISQKSNSLNYTDLRGSIAYGWNNGSVSLGKDQQIWGYGEGGRIILSEKAPAYPYIRLDYQPLKWLKFHYSHAWLHSNMIDSAHTYSTGNDVYGGIRETYIPKFLASHSFTFLPVRGLSLSIGESIVYSDRADIGYFIPVMFFKAYDHYSSRYKINTGANGQFFFQASSRDHIRNTHLYASLFIDEIRTSSIFDNEESRNQVGFQIGGSITDLFMPYLTAGIEYSRINPFVYQNLAPIQNYTSHDYLLGDWIGQNADRTTAFLKYNPVARLTTRLQLDYIRKGQDGTVHDQYFAQPQPKFLEGGFDYQKMLSLEVNYELKHKLYLQAAYFKQAGVIRPDIQTNVAPQEFRFGVSYGL
ncbi:capsule assembly Wzi family protein [Flavihumibacter sp. R14]|nr:capsule assembly Wzi family protein [Flavihumibacter soli]